MFPFCPSCLNHCGLWEYGGISHSWGTERHSRNEAGAVCWPSNFYGRFWTRTECRQISASTLLSTSSKIYFPHLPLLFQVSPQAATTRYSWFQPSGWPCAFHSFLLLYISWISHLPYPTASITGILLPMVFTYSLISWCESARRLVVLVSAGGGLTNFLRAVLRGWSHFCAWGGSRS